MMAVTPHSSKRQASKEALMKRPEQLPGVHAIGAFLEPQMFI